MTALLKRNGENERGRAGGRQKWRRQRQTNRDRQTEIVEMGIKDTLRNMS